MKFKNIFFLFFLFMVFILSGCVARTYQVTRERVDQDLPGNRGCVQGKCLQDEKERKKTRTLQVVEIEMPSFSGRKRSVSEAAPEAARGEGVPQGVMPADVDDGLVEPKPSAEVRFEKYTVLKDDTLQKISEKFYGTPGKWEKIYNANKATLKSPDRLYPGQSIDIPMESGKTTESIPKSKKVKDNIK